MCEFHLRLSWITTPSSLNSVSLSITVSLMHKWGGLSLCFLKVDDDDDETDDEQETNRTGAFQPGQTSTPYHGGEQFEMQTMQHENTGLPDTSYQQSHLLSRSGSITDLQQESFFRQKIGPQCVLGSYA